MHKYHNHHAILHRLYMWFDKTNLGYSNGAKNFSIGGGGPTASLKIRPMRMTPG